MSVQLEGEHGVVFMGSDTPQRMEYRPGSNFSMSLSGRRRGGAERLVPEARRRGTVTMPLEKAPWGDTFGYVSSTGSA